MVFLTLAHDESVNPLFIYLSFRAKLVLPAMLDDLQNNSLKGSSKIGVEMLLERILHENIVAVDLRKAEV